MDIVDRIQSILGKQSNIASLERELELGNGTIGKWRKVAPSCSKIGMVANHLDCSVDYLLGRTDNPKSHKEQFTNNVNGNNNNNYNVVDSSSVTIGSERTNDLSVDESEMVRIYRQLDAKQRHKMMSFVFDIEEQSIKQVGNKEN